MAWTTIHETSCPLTMTSDVETVQVRILQTRFKEWLREAPFFGGSG